MEQNLKPTYNKLTVKTQQRNFVADLFQAKCDFRRNWAVLRFLRPPLGSLGATYDDDILKTDQWHLYKDHTFLLTDSAISANKIY